MKTIASINQKGGVGKTSTTVNLGYSLAKRGFKTLLIDLDPQGQTTLIYDDVASNKSFVDLLFMPPSALSSLRIDHLIIKANDSESGDINNLFLIPSNIKLAMASEQIGARIRREKILVNHIKKLKDFDFVIIDCPPTLGLLSINAIEAADHFLIPVNYSRYATEGMRDLLNVIAEIKEWGSFSLSDSYELPYWILRNARDSRNGITNRAIEQTFANPLYAKHVLKTIIRKTEAINQAQMKEQPVFISDPHSPAVEDFEALTTELLEKLNG
jgi:chromosome partitioning protein